MSQCVDPIVGKILAGWRYDISGLAPGMREDYEEHFDSCAHCRSRQHLHRNIDLSLIALASLSGAVFLMAFGVILHLNPRHCVLAGSGRAGGIRAFRPDLAGSGSDHARAHGGSRRRQTGSPPRPRSPARRNPRTPAGRIPPENYRLVTEPPQAVRNHHKP